MRCITAVNLSVIRHSVKMDTHTSVDNVLYLCGLMILNRSLKNNTKSASFVWLYTWSFVLREEYSLKVLVKRQQKTTKT